MSFASQSTTIEKIKRETEGKNKPIIIVFFEPEGCAKCYAETSSFVDAIEAKNPGKYQYIAVCNGNRQIEVNLYAKEVEWKYPIFVNDNKIRSVLNLNSSTIALLMDSKMNLIKEFPQGKLYSYVQTINQLAGVK